MIALALPDLGAPYSAETAHHIVEVAHEQGWIVQLEETGSDPHREHELMVRARSNLIDGLILNPANQAQLVNVIAPIFSEENGPAWRQTIFHPFARMAELAKGQILRLSVDSDKYENARFGGTDLVDVSATWNEETGRVALFLANRGLEEAADIEVSLRGFDVRQVLRAEVLEIPDGGTVSPSTPKAVLARWVSSPWKGRRRPALSCGQLSRRCPGP